MKTSKTKSKLSFKRDSVSELNHNQLVLVKGGSNTINELTTSGSIVGGDDNISWR